MRKATHEELLAAGFERVFAGVYIREIAGGYLIRLTAMVSLDDMDSLGEALRSYYLGVLLRRERYPRNA